MSSAARRPWIEGTGKNLTAPRGRGGRDGLTGSEWEEFMARGIGGKNGLSGK